MDVNQCLLPATGGGLMLAAVALVLILTGSVAVMWSRRGRWLLVIALAAGGGLIGTERAQAAPAPCAPPPTVAPPSTQATSTTQPAAAAVSVSDPSPAAGESIVVSGTGFPTATTLSIELFSDPVTLGTATSNGTGSFTQTVMIPADTPAGRHTLTVTGGEATASTTITVTTPDTTTTSPEPAPGAPNATDKTIRLIETEEITGSLLDGDDLGPGAAATIAAVWDAANDEPLAFGDRRDLDAVDSGGTAAPCGAITVAADGSYTFVADSDVAIETTCAVRYRLEHPAGGSDTATVTFTVSPGREPRVLNRFVTVERGEVLTGNLLDGADLGAPTGTLVSVANISAPKDYEFGVPDALTGIWLDETFDDCGELTVHADGSYRFAASATIGPWKCDFQYVVANPLGDDVGEVFITFEVEPPNAIDKSIFLVGAQTVTGSLLDDDDFGDVGAVTLFDVWDTATDASLQPDTPADLAGTDTNGDPADCGTITVDLDGNYTFTAAPVATEVTCAIAYIIEQDVTGQWDSATVTFTISPGSAPGATAKWRRVELGGEYTGNLLDGADLGTPAAELVAVSSARVFTVPFDQTVTLVDDIPSTSGVAPCGGQITVEANGDYRLQMVNNLDSRVRECPVQYRIENAYGSAEGELTFTIGFDNPNATDKTITVAATGQVSGSLLAGDEFGNPQARFSGEIGELDGGGQQVGGFGTGSAHGLNGVDSGGSVVPCGTITVDNDGGYVFTAADVASEVTCSIVYGLHVDGGGSDTAVVTFVVSPRPVEPAADPTSTTTTSTTSTTAPAPTTTTTPTPAPSTTTTTTTIAAPSTSTTTSTTAPEPSTTSTTLDASTTSTTSTTTTSTPTTTTTTASSFM